MLTSLRSLIARAMLRLAIATAPDAAALRLQEALGPTWQALRCGGALKMRRWLAARVRALEGE